MPQVHSEMESAARIRVVGVGGSGKNAINHMVNARVRGVDFMVFIAGGMGGGTCTGGAPIVAKIAKDSGALTVAVVTKPFSFEGQQRMRLAEQGLDELRKEVDALIVIPNDRLLAIVDQTTTVKSAFALCDEILRQAVEGVSDLITTPGNINLDFADIKAIMEDAGSALMGVGLAAGDKRAEEAARPALHSPLFDISLNGAKGVLLSIAGGEDLGLLEVQAAAQIVTESIDKNAKVIFGTSKDDRLKKGEVRVTVIATGFAEDGASARGASLFQLGAKKDKKEKEDESAGKIYNTAIPTPLRDEETVAPVRRQQEEPTPKPMEEDDDWSAVPAFLRRSKKN